MKEKEEETEHELVEKGEQLARKYLLRKGTIIDKDKLKQFAREIGFIVEIVALIPKKLIDDVGQFRHWVKEEYSSQYDVGSYANLWAVIRPARKSFKQLYEEKIETKREKRNDGKGNK